MRRTRVKAPALPALAVLLSAAGCGFFEPDPAELSARVFETPFSELRDVAFGGTVWQGHDVWLSFRTEKPPRLKDERDFRLVSLADARTFLKDAAPCRALLEGPQPICLLRMDPEKKVLNGIVVVLSKDKTSGCVRSWEHR